MPAREYGLNASAEDASRSGEDSGSTNSELPANMEVTEVMVGGADTQSRNATYIRPQTRQRIYKAPPPLAVPNIEDDAAERAAAEDHELQL